MPVGVRPLSVNTFSLSSLQEEQRQVGKLCWTLIKLNKNTHRETPNTLSAYEHRLCDHTYIHTHLEKKAHLRTENILAIFPIARILFLITSLRAAAAFAAKKYGDSHYRLFKYDRCYQKLYKVPFQQLNQLKTHLSTSDLVRNQSLMPLKLFRIWLHLFLLIQWMWPEPHLHQLSADTSLPFFC